MAPISIPAITQLPTPPSKTRPSLFADEADTFLEALPTMQTEQNAAIVEMNKIISGLDQTEPIAAWAAGVYDFPDVVAGSDGYNYRAIATTGSSDDPVGSATGDWVQLAVTPAGNQTISGVKTFTSSPIVPTATAAETTKAANVDFVNQSKKGRKNYLIDGNFDVWLEGTTLTDSGYGAETMWYNHTSTTRTVSRQDFTLGQTEVPGNPAYYTRTTVTTGTLVPVIYKRQSIEDVRSLSGKTATLSFWARCTSGTGRTITPKLSQIFGTGGSPSSTVTTTESAVSLTTSWAKYTVVFTVPSISGKTIGTDGNSRLDLILDLGYLASVANSFDIAQVQLEEGPVATEFEWMAVGETMSLVSRYYEQGETKGPAAHYAVAYVVAVPSFFASTKRATPSIALSSVTTVGETGTIGTLYNANPKTNGFFPFYNWTSGTSGHAFEMAYYWTADARL